MEKRLKLVIQRVAWTHQKFINTDVKTRFSIKW